MKVYVVVGCFDYEGFDQPLQPLGVFNLYSLAKECGEKHKKNYDGISIFECKMNEEGVSESVL